MTGIILQARMGSSRLPGKALLPLAGKPAVEHAMRALSLVPADRYVLATEPDSAELLSPIAARCGFEVFVGSRDNVLSRYAAAACHYRPDTIVRATGDNPLVSHELAREILRLHLLYHADYSGFLGIPIGCGVEVLDTEALLAADREAVDPYEREHVSPFLYRRPGRFRINRPDRVDTCRFADSRVTLDTPEDYLRLSRIFDTLYGGEPVSLANLLGLLEVLDGAGQSQPDRSKAPDPVPVDAHHGR